MAHGWHPVCRALHHWLRHLRLPAAHRRVDRRIGRVLRRRSHAYPDGCGVLRPVDPQPPVVCCGALDYLGGCGARWLGAAATASSAALGALFFLLIAVVAALAYFVAGSASQVLTSGLNDFVWAAFVLSSFPRAMLTISAAFGLWRAGLISNALFAAGVAAVVLALMGGTTWLSGGFWAPDGAYSRFVSPIIGIVWVLAVSRVLLTRSPATHAAW